MKRSFLVAVVTVARAICGTGAGTNSGEYDPAEHPFGPIANPRTDAPSCGASSWGASGRGVAGKHRRPIEPGGARRSAGRGRDSGLANAERGKGDIELAGRMPRKPKGTRAAVSA
jgi:hypothetical protein